MISGSIGLGGLDSLAGVERLGALSFPLFLAGMFRRSDRRRGNVIFLVREMVASPDQTRAGIRWFLSGVS